MFLARRKEIEEKMEKASHYDNLKDYIKTAEIRDESVLQVKDVIDVLLNGKLTGSSTRNIYEQFSAPWNEDTYQTALSNIEQVHKVLRQNVPDTEYFKPTLGIRLSARQGCTAENVILCISEGRIQDSVSEFIDCLLNLENPYDCSSFNEQELEKKLSINEVILLKTVSLIISKFSSMRCTV